MQEVGLEGAVLDLLAELGWAILHGPDIAPGSIAAERNDYREVVLVDRLREAVVRLNPALPMDAVDDVVKTALRPESQSVESENWRTYRHLVEGVPADFRAADGNVRSARARLIDFEDPTNNDFLAVNQFTVLGTRERRPDVVLFINGLPVVLMELKRPGDPNATLRGAFNQIQTYRNDIPDAFIWNQVTVISDGLQARAGSFTAGWEHYAPWKTFDGREVAPSGWPQYEVLLRGMFQHGVLLDLIRNFIAVYGEGKKMAKLVAKYHQYWAVRKAVDCTVEAVEGDGRAGVVWHTQGSGKSLEMLFYAGKLARHPAMENPTVVVLTDRNDLDDQLFDEVFAGSKLGSPLPESPVQAESRDHLKSLLQAREGGGIVFSTIQKFGLSQSDRQEGKQFPLLSDRVNIVVVVDEAHRSNYDFVDGFARHLRDGLPNATYIGFTGTPIESSDRSTRQVFGEYIDVYDLTQAVTDGATVKVYYEPRLAKVELPAETHQALDDAFAEATSGTEEEAQERLKTRWGRVEAIVGSDKRIRELAADIVEHWEMRREALAGKGMVVAMSRRIAVAFYNEIVRLRPEWGSDDPAQGRIKVVITGSASDDAPLQPHIYPKETLRQIKNRAKDPNDPLELVIVRDMWLTGFDSPSMHTMYVDKPMRGAPLMQAIARVNRTFRDKPAGLVVDYIGIAEDLKAALADYTKRDKDRQELGQDLRDQAIPSLIEEHEVVCAILSGHPWREVLAGGGDKAYLRAVAGTADWLLGHHPGSPEAPCAKDSPCLKCRFMAHARRIMSLFAICVPADEALSIREDVAFTEAVRASISKIEGTDREGVDSHAELDVAIKQIVSENISGSGVIDIYAETGMEQPDLSLIDEDFIEKFRGSDHPNLQLEMLKRLLAEEIKAVGKRNVVAGRAFSEMLANSVLRYQNHALDAAAVVAELVALAKQLKHEYDRGKELGLGTDEIAFYDAICQNDSAVLEMGDETLKKIARELVESVRNNATIDWSEKEQVRARMRATIRRLLIRYGYPPDKRPAAIDLVMQQAELFAHAVA